MIGYDESRVKNNKNFLIAFEKLLTIGLRKLFVELIIDIIQCFTLIGGSISLKILSNAQFATK